MAEREDYIEDGGSNYAMCMHGQYDGEHPWKKETETHDFKYNGQLKYGYKCYTFSQANTTEELDDIIWFDIAPPKI